MIAITGAKGLLGSFILKKLISKNQQVVALKRPDSDLSAVRDLAVDWKEGDITNSLSLSEILKDADTVIHAAAKVSFDSRAKEKIFQTNVIGTQNVVNACLASGVRRLIFISSVAALGRKKGLTEINEDNKWVDSELNSDYAVSKYLAELEVYRGQEEGLSVSIINPSVILSTANPNKSSAQLFNYVQKNRRFYTDGNINYVDVRDVADMVYKIYETSPQAGRFIASAGAIDLKDLLSKIAARLGKKEPSIKINRNLLPVAVRLEEIRCRLTGSEALISSQSVKMSGRENHLSE